MAPNPDFWLCKRATASPARRHESRHPGDIVLTLTAATTETEESFCLPKATAEALFEDLKSIFEQRRV